MKKGFTFIELIIVIGMIGILSAIGLVSMSRARESKIVETAAREIAAAVRLAQNNALTGRNASPTCTEYEFIYQNAEYRIQCSGNAPEVYSLKNGVRFINNDSDSVKFSIPFGTTNLAVNTNKDIKINKGDSCYRIRVSSSGRISESEITCP